MVPKLHLINGESGNNSLDDKKVQARFDYIHGLNELLYCNNGSWIPQPLSDYYGKGISIEEIALRVRGYMAAYKSLKKPVYLERAIMGCDYLVNERIYRDGHMLLQGHMTIDLPYSFAGEALLQLWKLDNNRQYLLENASRIGDCLVEYQVAGSVNHAVVPVQFLAQLYQVTGKSKYLKNCCSS